MNSPIFCEWNSSKTIFDSFRFRNAQKSTRKNNEERDFVIDAYTSQNVSYTSTWISLPYAKQLIRGRNKYYWQQHIEVPRNDHKQIQRSSKAVKFWVDSKLVSLTKIGSWRSESQSKIEEIDWIAKMPRGVSQFIRHVNRFIPFSLSLFSFVTFVYSVGVESRIRFGNEYIITLRLWSMTFEQFNGYFNSLFVLNLSIGWPFG